MKKTRSKNKGCTGKIEVHLILKCAASRKTNRQIVKQNQPKGVIIQKMNYKTNDERVSIDKRQKEIIAIKLIYI